MQCTRGARPEKPKVALIGNRQRIKGNRGKQLLRRRGERVERTFAHAYETGALRFMGGPESVERFAGLMR